MTWRHPTASALSATASAAFPTLPEYDGPYTLKQFVQLCYGLTLAFPTPSPRDGAVENSDERRDSSSSGSPSLFQRIRAEQELQSRRRSPVQTNEKMQETQEDSNEVVEVAPVLDVEDASRMETTLEVNSAIRTATMQRKQGCKESRAPSEWDVIEVRSSASSCSSSSSSRRDSDTEGTTHCRAVEGDRTGTTRNTFVAGASDVDTNRTPRASTPLRNGGTIHLPLVPFQVYVYMRQGAPPPPSPPSLCRMPEARFPARHATRSTSGKEIEAHGVEPLTKDQLALQALLYISCPAAVPHGGVAGSTPWTFHFLHHFESYFVALLYQIGVVEHGEGSGGAHLSSGYSVGRGWGYLHQHAALVVQLQPMGGGVQVFGAPLSATSPTNEGGFAYSEEKRPLNTSTAAPSRTRRSVSQPEPSERKASSRGEQNVSPPHSSSSSETKTDVSESSRRIRPSRTRSRRRQRKATRLANSAKKKSSVSPKAGSLLAGPTDTPTAERDAATGSSKEKKRDTIEAVRIMEETLKCLKQVNLSRLPLLGFPSHTLASPTSDRVTCDPHPHHYRTEASLPSTLALLSLPTWWMQRLWLQRHPNSLRAVLLAGGERRRDVARATTSAAVPLKRTGTPATMSTSTMPVREAQKVSAFSPFPSHQARLAQLLRRGNPMPARKGPSPTVKPKRRNKRAQRSVVLGKADDERGVKVLPSLVRVPYAVLPTLFPFSLAFPLCASSGLEPAEEHRLGLYLQRFMSSLLTQCAKANLRGAALPWVRPLEEAFKQEQQERQRLLERLRKKRVTRSAPQRRKLDSSRPPSSLPTLPTQTEEGDDVLREKLETFPTALQVTVSPRTVAGYLVRLLQTLRCFSDGLGSPPVIISTDDRQTSPRMERSTSLWGDDAGTASHHLRKCLLPVLEAWLRSPTYSGAFEATPSNGRRCRRSATAACEADAQTTPPSPSPSSSHQTRRRLAGNWWQTFPLGAALTGVALEKLPWLQEACACTFGASCPLSWGRRFPLLRQQLFLQLFFFLCQHVLPFWVRQSFHVFRGGDHPERLRCSVAGRTNSLREGADLLEVKEFGAGDDALGFVPVTVWRRLMAAEVKRQRQSFPWSPCDRETRSGTEDFPKETGRCPPTKLEQTASASSSEASGARWTSLQSTPVVPSLLYAALRFLPRFQNGKGTRLRPVATVRRMTMPPRLHPSEADSGDRDDAKGVVVPSQSLIGKSQAAAAAYALRCQLYAGEWGCSVDELSPTDPPLMGEGSSPAAAAKSEGGRRWWSERNAWRTPFPTSERVAPHWKDPLAQPAVTFPSVHFNRSQQPQLLKRRRSCTTTSSPNKEELGQALQCLEHAAMRAAVREGFVTPLNCMAKSYLHLPRTVPSTTSRFAPSHPLRQMMAPLHSSTLEKEYIEWRAFSAHFNCRNAATRAPEEKEREAEEDAPSFPCEAGNSNGNAPDGRPSSVLFIRGDGVQCFDRLRQEAVWDFINQLLPPSDTPVSPQGLNPFLDEAAEDRGEAYFSLRFTVVAEVVPSQPLRWRRHTGPGEQWHTHLFGSNSGVFPHGPLVVSQTEMESATLQCVPTRWILLEEPPPSLCTFSSSFPHRPSTTTATPCKTCGHVLRMLPCFFSEGIRSCLASHVQSHIVTLDTRHQPFPYFPPSSSSLSTGKGSGSSATTGWYRQHFRGIIQGSAVSTLLCHGVLSEHVDAMLLQLFLTPYEANGSLLYSRRVDDLLMAFTANPPEEKRSSGTIPAKRAREQSEDEEIHRDDCQDLPHARGILERSPHCLAVIADHAARFFGSHTTERSVGTSWTEARSSMRGCEESAGYRPNRDKLQIVLQRPSQTAEQPTTNDFFSRAKIQQDQNLETACYGVPWCGLWLQCRNGPSTLLLCSAYRSTGFSSPPQPPLAGPRTILLEASTPPLSSESSRFYPCTSERLEGCMDWPRTRAALLRLTPHSSFLRYRLRYPSFAMQGCCHCDRDNSARSGLTAAANTASVGQKRMPGGADEEQDSSRVLFSSSRPRRRIRQWRRTASSYDELLHGFSRRVLRTLRLRSGASLILWCVKANTSPTIEVVIQVEVTNLQASPPPRDSTVKGSRSGPRAHRSAADRWNASERCRSSATPIRCVPLFNCPTSTSVERVLQTLVELNMVWATLVWRVLHRTVVRTSRVGLHSRHLLLVRILCHQLLPCAVRHWTGVLRSVDRRLQQYSSYCELVELCDAAAFSCTDRVNKRRAVLYHLVQCIVWRSMVTVLRQSRTKQAPLPVPPFLPFESSTQMSSMPSTTTHHPLSTTAETKLNDSGLVLAHVHRIAQRHLHRFFSYDLLPLTRKEEDDSASSTAGSCRTERTNPVQLTHPDISRRQSFFSFQRRRPACEDTEAVVGPRHPQHRMVEPPLLLSDTPMSGSNFSTHTIRSAALLWRVWALLHEEEGPLFLAAARAMGETGQQ